MNTSLLLGMPLAAALSLLSQASVLDNFESYALGSPLHGQGSWQGWGNDPGATAYISDNYAFSGSQSLQASAGADQVRTFTDITSGQWTFKIKQYIPSGSTGIPYIVMYNKYPSGDNDFFSIQIQCDMDAGKVIDDYGGGAEMAMVKDAWVEWRFEIDLTTNTVTTYYNNSLFTIHPWKGGAGLLELAAVDLFANYCDPIYYDDLDVAPYVAAAHGVSDAWAGDVSGAWTEVTKWMSGTQYPDGVGNVATFALDLASQRVITVDTAITLGGITLSDPALSGGQAGTSGGGFALELGTHDITMDAGTPGHDAADLAVICVPSTNVGVGHRIDTTTGKLVLTDNTRFEVTGKVELSLGESILSGAGKLIKTGSGQLLLAGDNSVYSGDIRVEGGTLQGRGGVHAYGSGAITLTNNPDTRLSQNNYGGGAAAALSNELVLEQTDPSNDFLLDVIQSPGMTWAGKISNTGPPLQVNLAAGNDHGGLSYSLFQYTGDNASLSFASGKGFVTGNNYLGVGNANALGAANSARVSIGVDPASQEGLLATIATTIASPIEVAGGGNASAAVVGANIPGGTASYSGPLTLNASGNDNVRQTFLRSETGGTVVFTASSVIGNAAGNGSCGPLTKIGGGRIELDGNNSYLGNSAVRSGLLVLNHPNALGATTSTVNLGEATPVMAEVRAATTVGGSPESLGSWTTVGGGTYRGGPATLDGVTLDVNDRVLVKDRGTQNGIYVVSSLNPNVWVRATDLDSDAELVYGQQVKVTAGLLNYTRVYFQGQRGTGAYPGTLTLNSSPPDYHLDIVNPEVAILSSGVALNRNIAVVANGSSARSVLGGVNTTGTAVFGGNISLARNLTVTAVSGGSVDFSGAMTGAYGVTQEGTGKVIFSSNKAYAGATAVIGGGTLVVNGSLASSGVTLGPGSTLQGTGHVSNDLAVGGTLAPGNSALGTLTAGSAAFAASSVLAVEADGAGSGASDRLSVVGNLNIAYASLQLTVLTPLDDPVYVIASYGSLTGTFAGVVGLPAGYSVVYNYNSLKQIALVQNAWIDYSDWTNGFVGFTSTASAADPDGDGLTNQQEYAFGLNPTLGASVNPIGVPFQWSTGTFSYTRRVPALTGLGYAIETSSTLAADSWATDTGAVQTITGTADGVQTVQVTISPALRARPMLFVRVRAN